VLRGKRSPLESHGQFTKGLERGRRQWVAEAGASRGAFVAGAAKSQPLRTRYQGTDSNRARYALCSYGSIGRLLRPHWLRASSHHRAPDIRRGAIGEAVGRDGAIANLASLEIHMAKGQKRSNREVKKPKKTAAERAKASAAPVMGALGKGAVAGQKRR
jgi:hypothetical protein